MKSSLLISLLLLCTQVLGQDYDYYMIGDTNDVSTDPTFGVCLMGGATEDDNGSSWFLDRADGGNIVVIRASGSDGYNDYFYNQLGISVQSVESIVFNNANASLDPFVQRRLSNAEAIWIAGGDQYLYETYWKGTDIEDILNEHVNNKQYPIGGTSAGMAILGNYYFNAANGTVTSNTALNDPQNSAVSIADDFLTLPYLENTITDTHYDNPERKGRHVVFLAHLLTNTGALSYGIAADEYVAICIDESGVATVFGQHPDYEDYAYFLRTNCDEITPTTFSNGAPLTWDPSSSNAIEVCIMEATTDGNQQFNLNNWQNINGGSWEGWNVDTGSLSFTPSSFEACDLSVSNESSTDEFVVYPIPANEVISILSSHTDVTIKLYTLNGKMIAEQSNAKTMNVSEFPRGVYFLHLHTANHPIKVHKIIIE